MPLSWNLGTLSSWNPLGHSRLVTGLLYLTLPFKSYEKWDWHIWLTDLVITVSCIVLLFIYQTHSPHFTTEILHTFWSFVIIPHNEFHQLNTHYYNRFSKLSILTHTHLGLLWGGDSYCPTAGTYPEPVPTLKTPNIYIQYFYLLLKIKTNFCLTHKYIKSTQGKLLICTYLQQTWQYTKKASITQELRFIIIYQQPSKIYLVIRINLS